MSLPIKTATRISMPIRPLRDHRFGLGPSATLSHDREGFSDPTPLADFCNLSREQGHTRRTSIPSMELAFSTLSTAPAGLEPELRAARHSKLSLRAGVRKRRRTGRTATSQLARSGAEADSSSVRAPHVTHRAAASLWVDSRRTCELRLASDPPRERTSFPRTEVLSTAENFPGALRPRGAAPPHSPCSRNANAGKSTPFFATPAGSPRRASQRRAAAANLHFELAG